MKANLDGDRIVHLTEQGTEIGALPLGVGLERLRFDGNQVVDLAALDRLWVCALGAGAFELHAVEVPGAQAVDMSYADRRRLTVDAGVIRLKTADELATEALAAALTQEKNRLRRRLTNSVGDQADQLADLTKLVYAVIMALVAKDKACEALLTALLPEVQAVYPIEQMSKLPGVIKAFRDELTGYYQTKAALIADHTPAATSDSKA